MSVFDWLAEPFRGPVGDVRVGQRQRSLASRGAVLARGLAAVVVLGLVYVIVFGGRDGPNLENVAAFVAIAGLYLAAGYLLHPAPDTSNVGWLGGLVNDPFHYTDNVNRQLVVLSAILLPARFAAESLIDLIRLLSTR